MKGVAKVVPAQGPYDLPPELHYLRPPPAWPPDRRTRTSARPARACCGRAGARSSRAQSGAPEH